MRPLRAMYAVNARLLPAAAGLMSLGAAVRSRAPQLIHHGSRPRAALQVNKLH